MTGGDLPHPDELRRRSHVLQSLEEALASGNGEEAHRILTYVCERKPLLSAMLGDIKKTCAGHGAPGLLHQAYERLRLVPLEEDLFDVSDIVEGRVGFWERANAIAPRLPSRERSGSRLFRLRRDKSIQEPEWTWRFRLALAIEDLSNLLTNHPSHLVKLYHPESKRLLAEVTPPGKSALYLVAHSGFTPARTFFITDLMPENLQFRRAMNRPPYVWKQDDAKTALFCCLKALQAGLPVLVAPDGPMGGTRADIAVTGRPQSIATGAFYLAYEAKVPVVWLNMTVKDDWFVPEVVAGPTAEPGEKLKAFNQRVLAFYEERLNAFYTGDPINLVW